MYIKKLSIEGYRCFSGSFEINFRKGLNVIVGENGAGKTTIINSFRQLFVDTESGSYSISSDDFNKPFKEKSIVR
ncbi:AAA family ATPase [Acinetobacter towneri]|uniref:AAA family ATPase n=1 Tax=Acinetobacter towneri TaxID=202956 RepID=UPI003213DCDA